MRIRKLVKVELINYFESIDDIIGYIDKSDIVYFRDPFNFPIKQVNKDFLEKLIEFSIMKNKILIDNFETADDFYFEDKWLQYNIFKDVMPKSYLLSDVDVRKLDSRYIIKKRLSSKATGVFLAVNEKILNEKENYIIQEKIRDYTKEYRVYII